MEDRGIDTLPSSLEEALNELERDSIIKDALGEYTFKKFIKLKKKECDEYADFVKDDPDHATKITQWEIDRYLIRV